MRKSLILLALSLAAAASPVAAEGVPSRSKVNLPALISVGDYPPSALSARQEGTVGFALDVAPDGRVTDCTVESSSGASALDLATCRIMVSRARFEPARDDAGRATADRFHGRIRWILPEPAQQSF